MRRALKAVSLTMLMGSLLIGSSVSAASTGRTYINGTYGYLNGETCGTVFVDAKLFTTFTTTTKTVPRLRTSIQVQYYSSGAKIGENWPVWEYNTNYSADEIDLHHFKNAQTNSYDGFLGTKCRAYGTSDAITSTPYVVYTSCVN